MIWTMIKWIAIFKENEHKMHFSAPDSERKARAKLRELLNVKRLPVGTVVLRDEYALKIKK